MCLSRKYSYQFYSVGYYRWTVWFGVNELIKWANDCWEMGVSFLTCIVRRHYRVAKKTYQCSYAANFLDENCLRTKIADVALYGWKINETLYKIAFLKNLFLKPWKLFLKEIFSILTVSFTDRKEEPQWELKWCQLTLLLFLDTLNIFYTNNFWIATDKNLHRMYDKTGSVFLTIVLLYGTLTFPLKFFIQNLIL